MEGFEGGGDWKRVGEEGLGILGYDLIFFQALLYFILSLFMMLSVGDMHSDSCYDIFLMSLEVLRVAGGPCFSCFASFRFWNVDFVDMGVFCGCNY